MICVRGIHIAIAMNQDHMGDFTNLASLLELNNPDDGMPGP